MTEPLTWRCACGSRPWLHYEHCQNCGRERPKPKPAEPTNDAKAEPDNLTSATPNK